MNKRETSRNKFYITDIHAFGQVVHDHVIIFWT